MVRCWTDTSYEGTWAIRNRCDFKGRFPSYQQGVPEYGPLSKQFPEHIVSET